MPRRFVSFYFCSATSASCQGRTIRNSLGQVAGNDAAGNCPGDKNTARTAHVNCRPERSISGRFRTCDFIYRAYLRSYDRLAKTALIRMKGMPILRWLIESGVVELAADAKDN
ncbi:hypothetical protein C7T94_08585 [Pedobacter yulinensis]|uniref:Uncharacterized protein n=1 Tax=Pedobacter yulinensis TaxID=2126353 RepID=A0A2T3HJX3_9SPHI|nr:hypothetical protein [Pedobacter yulinensis]PST82703.1 hypothetical protein C7T94_08585 [Pedobacter yulinensis]